LANKFLSPSLFTLPNALDLAAEVNGADLLVPNVNGFF
jgi:hypothetical protein